ncbi:MAG: ATP-binding protein [Actinomycetota bacterium]
MAFVALTRIVPRRLEGVVRALMGVEAVTILQGPRAVGKSTLLSALASETGGQVVDLDDLGTREAVSQDPAPFFSGPSTVFLDEFQHVPEVLDVIKAELNRDARPGRFVITGSTNYLSLPTAARTLTGRAHLVGVLPLSQGEIDEVTEDFAEALVSDPAGLSSATGGGEVGRQEYAVRAVRGGFPEPLRRARSADRARWFDDYVELVIERDVIELSRVRQRRQLPLLLARLAAQTGQVLNIRAAAEDIGMEPTTAENYTRLLEAVFLVRRLPAWGTTLGSRVGSHPKVHLADPGLAARLLRLTEQKLLAASAQALSEFGHLLETFAVGEITKQLGWLEEPVVIGHWRTHDSDEVDLVIEREDGMVTGVEVKAGSRVGWRDARSLRKLRDRLGSRFLGGVVLYTGPRAYSMPDSIQVIPLQRLWGAGGV